MHSQAMPRSRTATDENQCAYSALPQSSVQAADHEPESLGTVFVHFMFIMFISIMAIIRILVMMMDSNAAVQMPQLKPDSFSLSNFSISNSTLAATWELDLAFLSQHNGYEILFSGIEATVFYKDDDIPLAMTSWQLPVGPGRREQQNVHLKFETSGLEGDQPVVETRVFKEMKEEQEKGMVHFSMRVDTSVTYRKWGLLWRRGSQPGVNSYCWDLMVNFEPKTGVGSLVNERQKECLGSVTI